MSYENRLKELGLTSEYMQVQIDLYQLAIMCSLLEVI